MPRTMKQKRHTDEDVIVGGHAFRLPRELNDNVASCEGEEQGRQTLARLGIDFSGFGPNLVRVKPKDVEVVKPEKRPQKSRAG